MFEKRIPLGPVLVELVGPAGAGKSTWARENFTVDEIVSTDGLRREYLGDERRVDEDDLIYNEFDRRIRNRLEMGLRVVADATHIRATARKRTANLATKYGAQVIYVVVNRPIITKINHGGWRNEVEVDGKSLIVRHDETFAGQEVSILTGDGGRAKVVDLRVENPIVVQPLARQWEGYPPEQAAIADIKSRGYDGVLIVGDVHGNHAGLVKMIKLARRKNLFMLFLGDIVDYGTDTLKCAEEVAHIVFNGWGASVLGNHEKKIRHWVARERGVIRAGDGEIYDGRWDSMFANLTGFTGNVSHGNDVTLNQLKAIGEVERYHWETMFLGLCETMPHVIKLPGYTLVHGALDQHMLDSTVYRFAPRSTQESLAVFGQGTGEYLNGLPVRLYDWVDEIPPRMTAVVGHDCRQRIAPLIQQGAAGGRAIFMDTGSSKPDRGPDIRLSAMSLQITSRRKLGYVRDDETFYSDRDLA
jgi:protein phosphatase